MNLEDMIKKCLNDMTSHKKTSLVQEIGATNYSAEEIDSALDSVIQGIWMEMGDFSYFRSELPNAVKTLRNTLAIDRPDLAFMWSSMGYI